MKIPPLPAVLLASISLCLPACHRTEAQHPEVEHTVVVTSPVAKDVVTTQKYVCQIHSRRHIEVCALEGGYLETIAVKEGQAVKQGDTMFKILPIYYQAELDSAVAEAQLAQIEFNNTENLFKKGALSQQHVALAQAKLANAQAKVKLSRARLNFADIKAPFDGIIDRLFEQQGSLVEEGDKLTTLSDNGVMWVYFNVPEARYLEYMADLGKRGGTAQNDGGGFSDGGLGDNEVAATTGQTEESQQIELVLADGSKFRYPGKIAAIEGKFNNETGNIPFRADFPNPESLLRHGQTGSVLIHRTLKDAIVIPQRATFEILDKQYVFVVDDKNIVHQRLIEVLQELEDIFVVKGIGVNEKFVLEGIRQVRDGEKVEYEFQKPEDALSNQKFHAE